MVVQGHARSQGTPRSQRLRTNKYDKNITKRGSILDPTIERKTQRAPFGPIVMAFFAFVVIGSPLLQVLQKAFSPQGKPPPAPKTEETFKNKA